jgi:mannosyltransferase
MPGAAGDSGVATSDQNVGASEIPEPVKAGPSAWLVALILGVAASLIGFVNAWHVSMWVDEYYTLTVATRSFGDVWRMVHNIDIVHSLYNVMLHPWIAVAGVSDVTVRLPSTIAVGIATAGVYCLGRRLQGHAFGVTAALVFMVLPRTTWMAIEGRSYATTAAVAVWTTVLFVSLIRRPTVARGVGYAAAVGFAGSLNIFLVLLVGAHGFAVLLDRRVRFTRAFWTFIVSGVGGLLLVVPVLLTAMSQSGQIGATPFGPVGYLRSVLVNQWFLGGTPTISVSGGTVLGDAPGPELWKYAAVLLAALCWGLGLWGLWRSRRQRESEVPSPRLLVGAWVVVPTAVLVLDALLQSPVYNPRYLSYCAPAVALLVAFGLTQLRRGWPLLVAGVLIVALALPIYASQRTVYAKSGADWQPIASFISERRGPNQAVYFAPRSGPTSPDGVVPTTARIAEVLYPDAFQGTRDLTEESTPAQSADLLGRSRSLAESTGQLDGIQTVFVIRRIDFPADAVAAEDALLTQAGFRQVDSWTGPLDRVVRYTREPR